ncbi:SLC13 family permease [Rhodohalobacter sulfatireducens]|uniref:DASS family sodium-coupled anion symporter n=1 Tax=Rhodohalobacter sulfatireducens TaxID=2911366 RepID=A0ABS9K970_9BACT|nr:DASS family sodium-coupled anion symporter [Rhodohalobacter sulfatireducens]MCG2587399.1 DASS family sodium-coupled anion symporter [Rhodohalobacter sulfatireducens]
MSKVKWAGLILGLIGFCLPLFVSFPGLSLAGHFAMSIFLLAAVFWMFETIPIYSTSILVILAEVILLSSQGFIDYSSTSYSPLSYTEFLSTLADPIIILFLGGFILADASVKYDFDKSMTRYLLRPFGSRTSMMMLGLMLVTGFLSAFMSNTATTAMMITVILPIVAKMDPGDPARIGMALSVPFAANIGGMATPIGTPPNAVVIAALNQQGMEVEFSSWMIYAAPLAIVMLLIAWQILIRLYPPAMEAISLNLEGKLKTSPGALILYATFAVTVLLWVTESLHGIKSAIVALLPVAVLTLTSTFQKEDIRKLPWEVLWLIAGGISLGIAMKETGLAEWMVGAISWDQFGYLALLAVFATVALTMSNFLSNTVTASLLIPLAITLVTSGILQGTAGMMMIGLVIALGSSFAMILPISTPPNAIAVSTGMLKTKNMITAGLIIGLIGLGFILLLSMIYWPYLI